MILRLTALIRVSVNKADRLVDRDSIESVFLLFLSQTKILI